MLQRNVSRHGLLDTVYGLPLRDQLNSVQVMVSGEYCEGVLTDTVCWTRFKKHMAVEDPPLFRNSLRELGPGVLYFGHFLGASREPQQLKT